MKATLRDEHQTADYTANMRRQSDTGTISESEHYLSMNDVVSALSLNLRCMCQCYDIYYNCVAQTYY